MTHALTQEQTEILALGNQGRNLIVRALAGTGKTYTIQQLIKARAEAKIGSQTYLAFNVRIKEEFEQKMPNIPGLSVKTLNSYGFASLRLRHPKIKVNKKKLFNVIDEYLLKNNLSLEFKEKGQIRSLVDAARTFGLVPSDSPRPGTALLADSEENWESIFSWCDVELTSETLDIARGCLKLSNLFVWENQQIDFTDQLYIPTLFGGEWPKTEVLYIDEAQDLSPLNHRMTKLIPAKQKIFVGDPNQSIYAFRGAVSDSMHKISAILDNPAYCTLSTTFRCGKAIVERQKHYVPDYTAAPTNPDGEVLDWTTENSWSIDSIPEGGTVLCRNNAPLIKVALRFLAARRKVTILGRDFAETLKRDIGATVGKSGKALPLSIVFTKLEDHYNKKIKRATPTKAQLSAIRDKIDAVRACAEGLKPSATALDLEKLLDSIFTDNSDNPGVLLSTGHKSKGLEWSWVLHLSPSLIPAIYAETAEELTQEYNVKYVIETRAINTLVLAELEHME